MTHDRNYCLRILLMGILLITTASLLAGQEILPEAKYYGTGTWNADSLGNHRVVMKVTQQVDAVVAHIPWRRRDLQPELKGAIIIDAATGKQIMNTHWAAANREYGDVIFQPHTIPGEYYLYYLQYRSKGSRNYPKGYYLPPVKTASPEWLTAHGLDHRVAYAEQSLSFPRVQVVQFQSIDTFNSFYPMEVIVTNAELRALQAHFAGRDLLLFSEDRANPIKMTADLPYKWINDGPSKLLNCSVERDEYYTFQVGAYALRSAVSIHRVMFNGFRTRGGAQIPKTAFTCFNTEGMDWEGKYFQKQITVAKGTVQALWMGVQIPGNALPGIYEGEVIIQFDEGKSEKVTIRLDVSASRATAHGDDDPQRLTRLRWLNSRFAADDGIVPPFTPMRRNGQTVSCLGREVRLNQAGLPESIVSYFSPENTALVAPGRPLLTAPISLKIERSDGELTRWNPGRMRFVKESAGVVSWIATSRTGDFDVEMQGKLEFDGFLDLQLTLTARAAMTLNDIRLEIPMNRDIARYVMGMGLKGGYRPKQFEWKWDQKHNQDALWIGDVNAGFQVSLRDTNYERPLNTNFYLSKPLNMPPSWYNEGKGGFIFSSQDERTLLLKAFSGKRSVKAGQRLNYHCSFLITPFKLITTNAQWNTRYYHRYEPLAKIAERGANTINVHHATEINPYINYPFFRPAQMKSYIDDAHQRNFKVKIYYTVRELANRAPELFALRSFGDEVLSFGPGGGFSWLQEHLDQNYIAAWFVPDLKDAAVINSGVSRWHNFYVEGLHWLVKNVGIDGLYIDDVAFDRTTMKRVRKTLDRVRPGALIDLHSANQFNPRDGFANSANLYLEHFPYINRLWFGEYFDYNASPDFWLIEVSGIPFGLMGEMLEKGGNPWRGMVYGITSRLPWAGDPTPLWKVWDEFGMQGTKMFGYWSANAPVTSDNPEVLATSYVKKGNALLSLGSWSATDVKCKLVIDWKKLGMNPAKVHIHQPAIKDFQDGKPLNITEEIFIPQGKGVVLIVTER